MVTGPREGTSSVWLCWSAVWECPQAAPTFGHVSLAGFEVVSLFSCENASSCCSVLVLWDNRT